MQGIYLLILATVFWAGNMVSGRYLSDALPPVLLNTIRWGISTIILFGILLIQRKPVPLFKYWKEFLITGFLGIYAFSTLTYIGLSLISASRAGIIAAVNPVVILLFSAIILKEQIFPAAWIGTAISVIGILFLFLGNRMWTRGRCSVISPSFWHR